MNRKADLCRVLTLVLACTVPYSSPLAASDHWFILRANTKASTAVVDLTATANLLMSVGVLTLDGVPAHTDVVLGDDVFASVDLVSLVGRSRPKHALLGRASTQVEFRTAVTLRVDGDVIPIPPADRTLGAGFIFPVGELGDGTSLLLGNASGLDITVDVIAGCCVAAQRILVTAGGVTQVPLLVPSARYLASSEGGGLNPPKFLAALAVKHGQQSHMVVLLPE